MKPSWMKRMRPFALGLGLAAIFEVAIGTPSDLVAFSMVTTALIMIVADRWVWRES